jgi:hypothetical protein
MDRAVEPLKQKSMSLFVDEAKTKRGTNDDTKGLISLFGTFTGLRPGTLTHVHSSWFYYDEERLYLKVEPETICRKGGTKDPCRACRDAGRDKYSIKTYDGARRLKIPETWYDHYAGEERPTGLREWVEHYFHVPGSDFGNSMFNGDSLVKNTVNSYVKEVARDAGIGFHRKPGHTEHAKLGRVPDIFPHDLRATYCVQLMRNDANPFKAIRKTGHKDVNSMRPYIEFAEGEIEGDFEEEYI